MILKDVVNTSGPPGLTYRGISTSAPLRSADR